MKPQLKQAGEPLDTAANIEAQLAAMKAACDQARAALVEACDRLHRYSESAGEDEWIGAVRKRGGL